MPEKKAEKTIVTRSPIMRFVMADTLTFDKLYGEWLPVGLVPAE
jgi:hypothetical protein